MTTSATSDRYSVVATGAFTAGGVDISHSSSDTLKLPGGTFKVRHNGVSHGKQSLNPRTCLFTARDTGRYQINGGRGKYAGISGSGQAVVRILGVLARNPHGKSSMSLKPVAWQQTITATGPVRGRRALLHRGDRVQLRYRDFGTKLRIPLLLARCAPESRRDPGHRA